MRYIISLVFLFLSISLYSQSFLKTHGKAVVNETGDTIILRGMGLGGWMLQEGYMLKTSAFANAQYQIREKIEGLIGIENTDEFYEAWLSNHVTKADIDSLASWGFNSVRLPMHYNLFTLPIEDEPTLGQQTWLEKGFQLTDQLIEWCRSNGMYVVLDLHAAPGGQGKDQGISDYNPNKPSLWESEQNQIKTIALWKRIAQRYKDEPVIAAYDLINETNWQMNNNQPLKDLSVAITNAIREVDQNHIIVIEGNWFANDFTNMTPPWDDNMMYGPHKYWSINDKASIQWVIDIRDQYNVPIYFGESGENSNTWFRDAITLIESEGMGWAWWPMKKIDDIAGPLSINRSEEYDLLLDYWTNGGAKPSEDFAYNTLMQLTEDLKINNCKFQPDVIDAMFRQVKEDGPIPFHTFQVPGVVYASDFDMGSVGYAYHDIDLATYHVSTGNYTAWNRGWSYRNDGVDIESNNDLINSNGHHIGFVADGEWTQYSIDVTEDALYDVNVRVASQEDGGSFHLGVGSASITPSVEVPNTGGWTNFSTISIPDILLTQYDKKLRFYVDEVEFNISSFEFVLKASTDNIVTQYHSGLTTSNRSVVLFFNKPLDTLIDITNSSFSITADGEELGITEISFDSENPRTININLNREVRSDQILRANYSGNDVLAFDGSQLSSFMNGIIENNVAIVHSLPGKIEMEDYFHQIGVQLENTSDNGGGQNIGFLDAGDYLDYWIEVAEAGVYEADFRTAALSERGAVRLEIIEKDESPTSLLDLSFPSTGGWQSWSTTSSQISLPRGRHQLRVNITEPLFNMNWMEFRLLSTSIDELHLSTFGLSPNPANQLIHIKGQLEKPQTLIISIINTQGQIIYSTITNPSTSLNHKINLTGLSAGMYSVNIKDEQGRTKVEKFVKS